MDLLAAVGVHGNLFEKPRRFRQASDNGRQKWFSHDPSSPESVSSSGSVGKRPLEAQTFAHPAMSAVRFLGAVGIAAFRGLDNRHVFQIGRFGAPRGKTFEDINITGFEVTVNF
ncbi:MAG: hypothetical protein V3R30_13840 [Kiloniellales bacterium]